ISASAGADTFRRQPTLEKHLERARQRVEELTGQADNEALSRRTRVAQQRAAQEKLERLQKALEQVQELQKQAKEPEKVRVSSTEAFTLDAAQNCYTCPAGKSLPYQRKNVLPGQTKYIYQAAKQDCQACAYRSQCCPKSQNGRSLVRAEDSPEVEAFRAKMET